MACGTALDGSAGARRAHARAAPALPEERRQVTVLFADLSGYTAVAERMDPEAVKSLVDRSLRRLGDEVTRFGGTVDKYIGDNVMALFGAPVAHEDDEERAVRAALSMQDAMDEINRWAPDRVHVRPARGHQHGRGHGRLGRRELHRDRRHRERGVAPAVGRAARRGHRGRAHRARHPAGGPLSRAASR